jgi:hypothetical protein
MSEIASAIDCTGSRARKYRASFFGQILCGGNPSLRGQFTVEMLVRNYFPELRMKYDELLKIRDKIAKEFFTPFLTRAGRGEPCADLLAGFSDALWEFHGVSERFKEEIFLAAEKTRPVPIVKRLRSVISRQKDSA